MNEVFVGKTYKHYKGDKYKILGIGKHTETLEEMVYYVSLDNSSFWVRPKKMFFEFVEYQNKKVQRFELLP